MSGGYLIDFWRPEGNRVQQTGGYITRSNSDLVMLEVGGCTFRVEQMLVNRLVLMLVTHASDGTQFSWITHCLIHHKCTVALQPLMWADWGLRNICDIQHNVPNRTQLTYNVSAVWELMTAADLRLNLVINIANQLWVFVSLTHSLITQWMDFTKNVRK